MNRPDRSVFSKIVLSAVGILIALGAGEAILRYRDPHHLKPYWVRRSVPYRRSHPVYGHGLRPGASGEHVQREYRAHYRINAIGMRDREYAAQVPPGTVRVLMIGDSYTEGMGVEADDTFVKRIERALAASPPRPGTRYETVNLGVTSFSPLLEYLYLKETLPRIAGDVLVLNLDPSDFSDDFFYEKNAVRAADGTPLRVVHGSRLPNYLSHNRHYLEKLPGPPWRNIYLVRFFVWHFIRLTHKSWVRNRLGMIAYDRTGWTRPGQENSPAWAAQLDRSWGDIARIRSLAGKSGLAFVLTVYPYGHMVHPQAWCAGRRKGHYECGKVYGGALFDRVLARCRKAGMTCWDLRGAFRRPDAPELYYDRDGHFTPKGHAVMAEALGQRLRPFLAGLKAGTVR